MEKIPHAPISLGSPLESMMGIFNAKTTNTKAVNPAPVDLLTDSPQILSPPAPSLPLTESSGEIVGFSPSPL